MQIIWAEQALLESGWANNVAVHVNDQGFISSVIPDQPSQGHKVGILLPSPANAHSHAFQRAMAGLTEKRGPKATDSFWTWRQLMFRFLERLTPEHVESIAAFVQMEMLEAGYCANVEFHYLHHQPGGAHYSNIAEMAERIAAAASKTGIGLTLLPVHYQYGGCDKRPLASGQDRFGNDLDQYRKLHEASRAALHYLPSDTILGVAPHSLRAVDVKDLVHHRAIAETNPLHMHLAEQKAEVDEIFAAHGKRPVEWVLENMDLSEHCCFIHCTQMLEHETTELARSGAIAGLCPITESNLGDGIFDGVNWLAQGGSIAIGSDSNIRITLTEELRTLDQTQRLRDHSRAALATSDKSTGRRLFDAINAGGAAASGRHTGSITQGKLADLVALDATSLELNAHEGDTLLDCFVFAGGDYLVKDVWSAGRHVVTNGKHLEQESIIASYRNTMKELRGAL